MSLQRFSGANNGYQWYEAADLYIGELLAEVPCIVCHRLVAVNSFDSSPLILSEDERAAGWQTVEGIAISPNATDLNMLPHDQYDEWYIFKTLPTLFRLENFVNYLDFSLREPEDQIGEVDPSWDRVLIGQRLNWIRETQERFWRQLTSLAPESYVAQNGCLTCVTQNPEVQRLLDRLFAK